MHFYRIVMSFPLPVRPPPSNATTNTSARPPPPPRHCRQIIRRPRRAQLFRFLDAELLFFCKQRVVDGATDQNISQSCNRDFPTRDSANRFACRSSEFVFSAVYTLCTFFVSVFHTSYIALPRR